MIKKLKYTMRKDAPHGQQVTVERVEGSGAAPCSVIDVTKRGSLEKALCGALRQSINAHGDITYGNAPSAAKRLIGAIKQWNKQQNPTGQGRE